MGCDWLEWAPGDTERYSENSFPKGSHCVIQVGLEFDSPASPSPGIELQGMGCHAWPLVCWLSLFGFKLASLSSLCQLPIFGPIFLYSPPLHTGFVRVLWAFWDWHLWDQGCLVFLWVSKAWFSLWHTVVLRSIISSPAGQGDVSMILYKSQFLTLLLHKPLLFAICIGKWLSSGSLSFFLFFLCCVGNWI